MFTIIFFFKIAVIRKLRPLRPDNFESNGGGGGGGGATFGTLRYSLPRVKNRKVKSRITNEFLSRR